MYDTYALETEKFLLSAHQFIPHSQPVKSFFFRPVRRIAKSDYWLRQVCLSVRMEQLGSHWTDFYGNWYLRIFRKSIKKTPLNAELNPFCCLLALLGAHHFLHVSRIRVKSLTLRLLMSCIYIYMEHPFLMFLHHTQRRTTVGSLRPLACWDLEFEFHWRHGYLSVVSVGCCQVEVSATSWSLVQSSPTDSGASLCVI